MGRAQRNFTSHLLKDLFKWITQTENYRVVFFFLVLLHGCGSGGNNGGSTQNKNCSDFRTQQDAQAYFNSHGGSPSNNVDGLDQDHDGIACEGLPSTTTSPPVTTSPPATTPASTPAKIELKNSINVKQDSLGFVHYLGELINTGGQPACFVKIVIDSKNNLGDLIDSDFTYIDGSALLIFGTNTDTCLRPGEFAGFELFTTLKAIPASFTYTLNWDPDNISEMTVSPSQVVINGNITQDIDSLGNKEFKGFIKNLHPSTTIDFVHISFVALNGNKVVDTAFTYINGSNCGSSITTDTCLIPGGIGSFTVSMSVPSSEITTYYYKISYNISQ